MNAGYGFEETKRVVRDKRICFTTLRRSGKRRQGRDLNSAVPLYNDETLNCRNRATNNLHHRRRRCGVLRPELLSRLPLTSVCFLENSRNLTAFINSEVFAEDHGVEKKKS